MGGAYEVKDSVAKKYYSIAGMTVAMHDGSAVQYLLTDHLGSTVAVINSSGTLTSQQRYLPFGGVRSIPNSPILSTDFGYTGQRLLDAGMGGIMDYKARFYSVGLGRFLQPDTIIPDQSNPQSWNRFSYVRSNPVNFNDPTGHRECDLDFDDCRAERNNSPQLPNDDGLEQKKSKEDNDESPCKTYLPATTFDYCEGDDLKIHGEPSTDNNLYGYHITNYSYFTEYHLNGSESQLLSQTLLSGCRTGCTNAYRYMLEELFFTAGSEIPYIGRGFDVFGLSQFAKDSSQKAFGNIVIKASANETATFSPITIYVNSNYSSVRGNEVAGSPLYLSSILEISGPGVNLNSYAGGPSVVESIQNTIMYAILNR